MINVHGLMNMMMYMIWYRFCGTWYGDGFGIHMSGFGYSWLMMVYLMIVCMVDVTMVWYKLM
jgi:hypothetical protein